MGKVIGSTTMTLDGVATPGEWYVSEGGHDAAARELFERSAAMLMGRKTYEGLAGYWSPLEGPWADRLNAMPKFVGSRTLEEPLEWNARLLEGEIAESIPNLKDTLEGDLIMSGCGEFARELLARDLVEELRFWVHPALWSTGVRPFEGEPLRLRLLGSNTFDSGVTLLRYEPIAAA